MAISCINILLNDSIQTAIIVNRLCLDVFIIEIANSRYILNKHSEVVLRINQNIIVTLR